MDDQVLDLALMTNYSQSTFMLTVASSLSLLAQIRYCLGWSSNTNLDLDSSVTVEFCLGIGLNIVSSKKRICNIATG